METSAAWSAGGGDPRSARPTTPAPPRSALGPRATTARDLAVLAAVVVIGALILWVRSGAEYPVPVSLGNITITNTEEILSASDEAFDELVRSQGGRVAEGASCYFYRPLGPTQGAMPAGFFPPGLLPGGEDADAIDMVLCGPVELSGVAGSVAGIENPPWVPGIVYYYESGTNYRGEFQRILPMPVSVLASGGLFGSEDLLTADGHSPDRDAVEDPRWREVSPSGDPLPPGGGFPGGSDGGSGDGSDGSDGSDSGLPPGVTLPPGISVPTLPPNITLPSLPDGSGG